MRPAVRAASDARAGAARRPPEVKGDAEARRAGLLALLPATLAACPPIRAAEAAEAIERVVVRGERVRVVDRGGVAPRTARVSGR